MKCRLAGLLGALALVFAGTAGSVAAGPYPPEYRACVAEQWRIFNERWDEHLKRYPWLDKEARLTRNGHPHTYEEALAHPDTQLACPLNGDAR